jgi:dTDP-4-dehydrorhamnose 3,5-epimerase-like enzyme
MATLITLKTHIDSRGYLTVVENVLPFDIKRVYYLYNCSEQERGGHRHKKTIQGLVCVKGSCVIDWNNKIEKGHVILAQPDQLLIVFPEDYHTMHHFSKDAVLLVLASEYFDADDYIDTNYEV